MTTFTRTWNAAYEASPPDSQNASQGALRIREDKIDTRERLAVDHSWTGDANDGAHKKVTLIEQSTDPTAVANTGFLYAKDDGNGNTEIYYRDAAGTITRVTNKGSIGYVGEIKTFAFNSVPTGWLKCNGAVVSRTTYADLFAAIGTTYGAGDGSTTFGLPDLRGEFLRGFDDGRGVDSGRVFGSAQSDNFKSHTHTNSMGSAGAHTHTFQAGDSAGVGTGTGSGDTRTITTSSAGAHTHSLTIDNAGGSETRPRNIAMLMCIKY